ncbi:MAG: MBL fold metallo-hydrolase [Deltaproteobacteria bacterium]|nr:MBL fold metallo-hydrolase [Deltaproteobacteria bacterium]
MRKISKQVYVETEFPGANVGCVITEIGPILIDTPMLPEEADRLRKELFLLSDLDIAHIIYTHQHFDHVIGSAYLSKRTIAHQGTLTGIGYLKNNLKKEINLFFPDLHEQRKDVFDHLEIVLPQITFTTELTLYIGDVTLQLSFTGGHSSASIIIYIPEERVLFMGDNLATGMLPVTANCRYGQWIDLLERVEQMDVETYIPGHGDVCGKETVRGVRLYFEAMRDRVRDCLNQGVPKEKVFDKIHLKDSLPLPFSEEIMQQSAFDVSIMCDQIVKGYL